MILINNKEIIQISKSKPKKSQSSVPLSVVLKMNAISVADFDVHWWLTYNIIKYVFSDPGLLISSKHSKQISLAM